MYLLSIDVPVTVSSSEVCHRHTSFAEVIWNSTVVLHNLKIPIEYNTSLFQLYIRHYVRRVLLWNCYFTVSAFIPRCCLILAPYTVPVAVILQST